MASEERLDSTALICAKETFKLKVSSWNVRRKMNKKGAALIAGSTGIVGGNLAALLVEQGWTVYGLARRPTVAAGVIPVAADLRDRNLFAALTGIAPTHVFFCSWLRQSTEAENVAVNGEMTENLFAALRGQAATACGACDGDENITWAPLRPTGKQRRKHPSAKTRRDCQV